mmetsp:Transcript_33211/g.93099  ORF Transcript_33211/g.93099 Transcript_33211/m.93099 type:complete len:393 (+) Transcript_33211:382-1560(+)
MHAGGDVGEVRVAGLAKHGDARAEVAEVERALEAAHGVPALLRDLQHASELDVVAADSEKEGELFELLRLLVRDFHHLEVALPQGRPPQLRPYGRVVDLEGRLRGDVDVAALQGQLEAGALVLDEVECDFGEALLLEVRDDGLTDQVGPLDNVDEGAVAALHEGQLEHALSDVHRHEAHLALPVQAVQGVPAHGGEVDGHVQRADDTAVTIRQAVLDVVQRSVVQNAVLVPRGALDLHRLVHAAELLEAAVDHHHRVACHHRRHAVLVAAAPHHELGLRHRQLHEFLAHLHVVQHELVLRLQQHAAHAREEHLARGLRARQRLGGVIVHVFDEDLVLRLHQDGEPVARDEHGRGPAAAAAVGGGAAAAPLREGVPRHRVELVGAALRVYLQE